MKDFTLYYLFKMQPNALLIWQNFIVCKKQALQATTLDLRIYDPNHSQPSHPVFSIFP
jgi:hypothetical protein